MNRKTRFNRRHFLGQASSGLLLSARSASCRSDEAEILTLPREDPAPAVDFDQQPTRAVSLGVLQDELRHSLRTGAAESGVSRLPGLNRITGHLVHDSEVVAYGHENATFPLIEIHTLAVALRSAFQAGNDCSGVVGCTIDPIPGVDPWRIQQVRVFGMPHDCSLASRLVSLDYELKLAGAGIAEKDGKILRCGFELSDSSGLCSSSSGLSGDTDTEVVHRYWFFPEILDRSRFERDGTRLLILQPVGVQLLSEQEFMNGPVQRIRTLSHKFSQRRSPPS